MIGLLPLILATLILPGGDAPTPPSKPESVITFHGWSPDSTQVGWDLERRGGGGHAKKIWYLRESNRTLHGKASLREVKHPVDETFPAYYAKHDFALHDLPVHPAGHRTRAKIALRYDRSLVLELRTEDKIRLYYWFEEGMDRLLLHVAEFDEIYFGFDARAWLSPNGRRVALALALDGDIRLDSAFVVLVLPVSGWQDAVQSEDPR